MPPRKSRRLPAEERAWNPGAEAAAASAARQRAEWRQRQAARAARPSPLADFFDRLPLEVVNRCLGLMDPFTLLRLTTLSKAVNRYVAGRERHALWETMLDRYGISELCPVTMSLPRFTNLIFAMFCTHCGNAEPVNDYANDNASFVLEIVLCADCQDEQLVHAYPPDFCPDYANNILVRMPDHDRRVQLITARFNSTGSRPIAGVPRTIHWPTYYRPHLDAAAEVLVDIDSATDAKERLNDLMRMAFHRLDAGIDLRNLIEARIEAASELFENEVAALRQADKDDEKRALETFEARYLVKVIDHADLHSIRARLMDAGLEVDDLVDLRLARYGYSFFAFWFNCGDSEVISDETWDSVKDKLITDIDGRNSRRDANLNQARLDLISKRLSQLVEDGRLSEGPLPAWSVMRHLFPRSEWLEVEEHGPIGVNVCRLVEPVERWRDDVEAELCDRLRDTLGDRKNTAPDPATLTRPWALFECTAPDGWPHGWDGAHARKLFAYPAMLDHRCALAWDDGRDSVPTEVIGPSIEPVDCRELVDALLDHLGLDSSITVQRLIDCGKVFVVTDALVLEDRPDEERHVRQLRGRTTEDPARLELLRRLRCQRHSYLELIALLRETGPSAIPAVKMGEVVRRTAVGDGPADPLPRIYGCNRCSAMPVTGDEEAMWDHVLEVHREVAVPNVDATKDAIFALAVPKDDGECT